MLENGLRGFQGKGAPPSVVFQSCALLPWLTAIQNVEFALAAAGYSRSECHAVAKMNLHLVDLDKFAHAYPNQLSGGMKQRVAIARALSYRPKVLLMDEPFGALDAMTRRQMQDLLTAVCSTHRLSVLFITHDVAEAIYLSDRIVVMRGHPGSISAAYEIDLPRPRTEAALTNSRFCELQRSILTSIRGRSELTTLARP